MSYVLDEEAFSLYCISSRMCDPEVKKYMDGNIEMSAVFGNIVVFLFVNQCSSCHDEARATEKFGPCLEKINIT